MNIVIPFLGASASMYALILWLFLSKVYEKKYRRWVIFYCLVMHWQALTLFCNDKLWSEYAGTSGIFYSITSFLLMYSTLIFLSQTREKKAKCFLAPKALHTELAHTKKRLAESQMALLHAQLNPHFMFNTLNSIHSMVNNNGDQARDMITKMCKLLRWVLSKKYDEFLELGEEIRAVTTYLEIEKIRLGKCLNVILDIDESVYPVKTLNYIIQPLVENAVKYGHQTSKETLSINLSVNLLGVALVIRVRNSGTWIDPETSKPTFSHGIGIHNLKCRLQSAYGDRFTLEKIIGDGFVQFNLSVHTNIKAFNENEVGLELSSVNC